MFCTIDLLHDLLPNGACRNISVSRAIRGRWLRIFAFAVAFPDPNHELRGISHKPRFGLTVVCPCFTCCGPPYTEVITGRIGAWSNGRNGVWVQNPFHHFIHNIGYLWTKLCSSMRRILKHDGPIAVHNLSDPDGLHSDTIIRKCGISLGHLVYVEPLRQPANGNS